MRPRLREETPFSLQFDDEVEEKITIRTELAWGTDPMDALLHQQECEREELEAYLRAHTPKH